MNTKKTRPRIETRLSSTDMDKLTVIAAQLKKTKATVAREAIKWFMSNHEEMANQVREEEISKSLRSMTDRICGMLARQGAQTGTLYELAWQSHVEAKLEDRFVTAANLVKQKMRKRLTEDERIIAERMRSVVK